MWILFSIGVGFVAIVIVAVLATRDRKARPNSDISGDDLFALGVVFVGAGVAMSVTLGPIMVWMIALGVIYMGMGTQKKRHH
ncbi:MAG: hypothetical protein ACR2N9_12195 [Acidimicrobiia bacterium]